MKYLRPRIVLDGTVWLVSSAFLAVLLASQADAAPPPASPAASAAATWREECGSCHIPFPAKLLPASGWNAVLDSLDRHYGVDASLAPTTVRDIRGFLVARSGPGPARSDGAPRITTSAWFREEHEEVAPAAWKRPAVRSAATCGACHAGAAQGNFDEDNVRIPK